MGGLGSSRGKKVEAALIAAWTSCSATSMFRSRLNCRVMSETPNELTEVIWLRPGTCPNWRSSGVVTEEARSEERRVGKERRPRWAEVGEQKKDDDVRLSTL